MAVELDSYQLDAIEMLKPGAILCGGVGSGKSRTALGYFLFKVAKGKLPVNASEEIEPMQNPTNLFIITTARKRDTLEWEKELVPFLLSSNIEFCYFKINIVIDSWNNIKKYTFINNAFFIFDEQRLVGSGVWVKSFLKIAKNNAWILLTATPGDSWIDYIPVFIANGFYKNRTEFLNRHVVFVPKVKFPKIDHFIGIGTLISFRKQIMVNMEYHKKTKEHHKNIFTEFNKELTKIALDKKDPFENIPIKNSASMYYVLRKIVNSDPSRLEELKKIFDVHKKVIVFYSYDYELELLRTFAKAFNIIFSEWNGHKHQPIPTAESWLFLVQYTAGAEGWNCLETNVIVFYSQIYSYKTAIQAAGRIDRRNTPFLDLYYYHFLSNAWIDYSIKKAFSEKRDFNEQDFGFF